MSASKASLNEKYFALQKQDQGNEHRAMAKDQNLFNERASRPKFDCYFIGKDLRDDPRFADFVRRFERAKSDRVERRTNDRTIG